MFFSPALSVSTLIAGTALFRPPRGTRNTVVVIVIVIVVLVPPTLNKLLSGERVF